MSRIERVSYRSGFVERLGEAASLPAITFEAADLPEDVGALVDAHLLDFGGTYGDPRRAIPSSTDELRIEHYRGDVEIVVYNRAVERIKEPHAHLIPVYFVLHDPRGRCYLLVPQLAARIALSPSPGLRISRRIAPHPSAGSGSRWRTTGW